MSAEDGSLVDVRFGRDDALRMRVFLPPKYPADKPVVQLMQSMRHPSVDRYNQVTHLDYLEAWSAKHTLTELVERVVALLDEKPPPEPKEDSSSSSKEDDRPQPGSYRTQLPSIPLDFPQLDALSDADLERLLDDDDDAFFRGLFDSLEPVKNVRELRAELLASKEHLARELLETTEKMESAAAETLASREQLRDAAAALEAHAKRASALAVSGDDARAMAIADLRAAARKADAVAESVADDIVRDRKPVATWQEYLDARVRFHEHDLTALALENDLLAATPPSRRRA